MPFQKIDVEITPATYESLSDEKKMDIVDCYAQGKGELETRHDCFVDMPQVEGAYRLIEDVYNHTKELCSGKSIQTPESFDEELNKIEAIYKGIPATIEDLKAQSLAKYTQCTKIAHEYLIDKIIGNSTTEGTYQSFLSALQN